MTDAAVQHTDMSDDEPEPINLDGDETDALTQAGRHLRAIARLEHEHAVDEAIYRAELRRLNDWWDARSGAHVERLARHRDPLVQLHARLLEADPRRKTISLPAGTLRARTLAASATVVDQHAFCEWALASRGTQGLVETTVRPKLTELRRVARIDGDRVLLDGEVVPGVAVVPERTAHTVTTTTERTEEDA